MPSEFHSGLDKRRRFAACRRLVRLAFGNAKSERGLTNENQLKVYEGTLCLYSREFYSLRRNFNLYFTIWQLIHHKSSHLQVKKYTNSFNFCQDFLKLWFQDLD